ncbi:MAG: hypothetical protein E6772_16690 [Dysgonomonas sp.]|nr:hypothetical protein [Dysgonomonas sp.]
MDRIHWTKLWEQMEQLDKGGKAIPFSLSFVKKSTGEIVDVPSCTLTSIHSKGSTLNILVAGQEKPKTIRKCLIIYFNGKSVYQ